MVYNRKRRNEFFALQKQLKADSLEAARFAYMTGTASEEQTDLVEEAEAKARQSGTSLPPLLSAPRLNPPTVEDTERSTWPGEAVVESSMSAANEVEQPKSKGLTAWLFGGMKKEEESDEVLKLEEEAAESRSSSAETVDRPQQVLKDKAKAAFEKERENQMKREGGPLDQLGLSEKPSGGESRKGGWW